MIHRLAKCLVKRLIAAGMAITLALAAGSNPVFAWGGTGHRAITRIALLNTTPATRAAIAELLRHAPELGTPQCRIDDLEDASTWADCVRAETWRWGYTTPWHYQNAPICAAIFDPRADCANGDCVTAQIERDRRILADHSLPAAIRLEALAFLVHFVGDIHQPLHVADIAAGGNGIAVANFLPDAIIQPAKPAPIVIRSIVKPISWHWFWDDALVKATLKAGGESALVRQYSADERARIATGNPADWARESWRMARDLAYPQAFGHDPCTGPVPQAVTMTDAMIARDVPVVHERLMQAGLRLARMLDEAIGA